VIHDNLGSSLSKRAGRTQIESCLFDGLRHNPFRGWLTGCLCAGRRRASGGANRFALTAEPRGSAMMVHSTSAPLLQFCTVLTDYCTLLHWRSSIALLEKQFVCHRNASQSQLAARVLLAARTALFLWRYPFLIIVSLPVCRCSPKVLSAHNSA
jgi:hypothetical protein